LRREKETLDRRTTGPQDRRTMLSCNQLVVSKFDISTYLDAIEEKAINSVKDLKESLNKHEIQCVARGMDSYSTNEDLSRLCTWYARSKARYNILKSDLFYQSLVKTGKAPELPDIVIDFSIPNDSNVQYLLDLADSDYYKVKKWLYDIKYQSKIDG
jgi:hypothetical protein